MILERIWKNANQIAANGLNVVGERSLEQICYGYLDYAGLNYDTYSSRTMCCIVLSGHLPNDQNKKVNHLFVFLQERYPTVDVNAFRPLLDGASYLFSTLIHFSGILDDEFRWIWRAQYERLPDFPC